ncbi:uncharacterized protein N7477_009529 [Penicillium maclennaniae]|uniref:uncharacterized protein n=1 Tax=Penicillium maclennaniae TaxID=1343394 RepID=UPI00253FFA4D|nr:uncharacterized protein N7477_009529 [Penicillium maclennaniae]KAJ5661913.1 hypothetical protein N7477_009529 [Penicillium maclennaniae]
MTYASLDLNIDNPATTPTYGLVAYGLVSIENSANFEAGVQLLTALDDPQKAGWCRVAVQSWPLDPATSSARFALDIYFRKDSQGNWKLTQVDFNLYAGTAADQWVVGQTGHQLTVARLWLSASFTMIDVPGSMTTSVSFNGVAVVSGAAFGITAQLAGSAVHITVAGAQDLQKLVGVFVDGGLDNSALKAPNFASNTSLDAYKTGTFAKATLAFRQQNNTYALDTITAIVETDQEWAIVQGILSMTKLKLTLTLQSMPSSSWLFNATLHSDIRYRKQDGSYDDSVTVDLAATLDYMTLTVRLNCSIFDIFYIATAGRWTLDIDFFPGIKSLYFSMNWKTGRAHFTGQTNDWNLFDDYPNIASIQQPTLTVDISRASSRLDASGVVSGDAVVAGIHIPVSYGLPDGPLKIFGYDIDQIYKMCKKLYELFKDLVTICEIMLDIVGAGEALAVGTAVWKAIKKVFGYGDDDDDDDNDGNGGDKTDDNTDRNSVSKPGAYSWVFGGPGLSNGIASEEVNVTVFPKDRLGRTLPIDSTQLTVKIVQNGVILSTINTFTGISRGGYVVSYVRPATLGDYTIHVSYPVALPGLPAGYSQDATVMVTNMAAVLSAENSILDVSENLLAGVMNYATIWPRDNFNNPRLGYDESESFSVEFTPPLEHVSFVLYNDCVKVAFVLPPQVGASYTIRATLLNEGGPQLSGSPAMFTSIRVVGLNRCIAGGPGLCSGLAGADTSFDVFLNDQMGQAWVGDMTCTASYTAVDGTTVNLVALQAGNQYHFTYTRPATTGAYILKISVNGELLPAYPIQLQATAAVVNLSVANSFVSLSAGPYYQTSNIVATITAYDNLSEPGLWRATSIAAAFRITTTLGSSGTPTSWPLSDRGDGTCFATLSLPDLGQYQVNATSADGTVIVGQGPVTVNVTVPPYIADARCFGPGLSLPPASKPATTYFDVVPLDQYGKMFAMSAMDTTSFLVFMKDEAQVTITPHGRGRRVTYAIPTASPLQANDLVRVLLNDADISGSPYALTSTSPTVPANCRVSQWLSHQVDEISSFIITAVDATGNARRVGGDQVKITSADSGPDWPFVVLNIRDRRDGTYLVRYIPNAVAMKINVLVNNLAIHGSPFSLPANVITFTASEAGIETSSLGVQSEFVLSAKNAQGLPVDISGFLIAAMIYPKSTTVLTAVPVTFKPTSPPAMGTVQGTYTIASTMPTGDYALRILVDCAAVVIGSPFTVSVNDAPPATPVATAVGISDVYFATSDLGTFAGSFLVLTDPPTPVSATDLVVVNAGSPGLPIELPPAFRVTVDATQIGVFNVLTAFRIEGSWPVTITYRGAKVLPPPNVGSQYVFSSCDAAKALAVYVPNQPPPSFAIQEQASVQVQVAAAGNSIKFVKDPKQAVGYQYASAGWSLPALDMGVEMIYHFRIRWNVLAQASEVQMLLPGITQFSRHEMVILRYFQGSTFWTTMDYSKDNAYTNVTQSTVKADGAWHFVCVYLSPTAMRIYEDGHLVVATDRRPLTNMAAFTIGFQVFDDAAAFDADVAECVTCPGTLHTDFSALSRRVEVLFNQSSQQINTQWYQIRQNTAIPVNYTSQGSLQFATSSLSMYVLSSFSAKDCRLISCPFHLDKTTLPLAVSWQGSAPIAQSSTASALISPRATKRR